MDTGLYSHRLYFETDIDPVFCKRVYGAGRGHCTYSDAVVVYANAWAGITALIIFCTLSTHFRCARTASIFAYGNINHICCLACQAFYKNEIGG